MFKKTYSASTVFSLAFALSVYCMLDCYQSKLLFDLGAIEANPLMAYLINITGTWSIIILVKIFFISSLILLLIKSKSKG